MEMPRTGITMKLLKKDSGIAQNSWTVQVTNSTGKVAFFVRFQLMQGNEEITPSLWSSNYITLAPGESVPVEVKIPSRFSQLNPDIQVSGWNVDATRIPTVK
jgi:exo-1,4-beta-D-glucosaminidase